MPSFFSLSISVHTQKVNLVDEVCRSAVACSQVDLLTNLLLMAVAGLVATLLVAAVLRAGEARTLLARERERTATERDAFGNFARRVSGLDANGHTAVPAGDTLAAISAHPDRQLEAVREAYEETVMSMPHYEEDYGEPLTQNMAAEFGEEIAGAIESETVFTPQLKQVLVQQSREAERRRETLITALERESEALEAGEAELTAIVDALEGLEDEPLPRRSFEDLVDVRRSLLDLEERCESFLADRQAVIHRTRQFSPGMADTVSLYEYVYGSLDVTHPLLASGTSLLERLRDAERRVTLALTRRV